MLVAMTEEYADRDAERALIRAARRAPMLTRDEERQLARRALGGDREAVARLVTSHMRLVIRIAERYRSPGLSRAELIHEGCLGLIQALKRFNPDHDARLSTYAMWWIKSSIQDHVVRSWSLVRIGTSTAQKSLFFNLRRMRAALSDTGDSMSEAAARSIARTLGVAERDVRRMAERLRGQDRSLDAPLGEEPGSAWLEHLPDPAEDPEEDLIKRDEKHHRLSAITAALGQLKDRERLIITRRYLSDVAVTLEGLGKELGISKERVRQIEATAMDKIRAMVASHARGRRAPA
jgi:RNA polymerase sigma-32 factor